MYHAVALANKMPEAVNFTTAEANTVKFIVASITSFMFSLSYTLINQINASKSKIYY